MTPHEPAVKHLQLFAGRSHPDLADAVASCLGVPLSPAKLQDFASGETNVRLEESVRGSDVFLLQSFPSPVNHWLMETLIVVDALKRAAASSITAVLPYYPYARQDRKGPHREAITAHLVADLLEAAGVNRIMSVDLHAPQIEGFFDAGPFDHLHAMGVLADYVKDEWGSEPLTVVSPDAGRVKVAEKWTDRLGAPLAIIHKRRDEDVPNEVKVFEVVGEVKGRTCVLVDDMIDTAGTIVKAAETLTERGAARVLVVATHGVLSDPARERLEASSIEAVVLTDTLPVEASGKVKVLSVAPVIASAIAASFQSGSVTRLFEGQA